MTPGLLQPGQDASAVETPKPVPMANAGQATLTMFRNKDFYVNFLGNDRVYDKMNPNVVDSDNIGVVSWSVKNSNLNGKPCKLFTSESTWRFFLRNRDGSRQWFAPRVYVMAHIDSEAGKLLRTQTSYAGYGDPIQVTAVYQEDKIVSTVTKGRHIDTQEIYPNAELSDFDNIFTPLLRNGLVVKKSHKFLMIDPYTGFPLEVKLEAGQRFQGKMFDAPMQGYRVRSISKYGEMESFISRAGQLLRVQTGKEYEGRANEAPTYSEIKSWKQFLPGDWNRPFSEVDPNRRRFVTYMAPVLLENPKLMVPWPCIVAM